MGAQLKGLVERFGVSHVKIADQMFVLNRRLCDLVIERRWGLNFWAYARVDNLKDAKIEKLARAGFGWLAVGIAHRLERRYAA